MKSEASQIDSSIQVVTPENIAFRYELAGPFRRLPAFLIDLFIRVGVFLAVAITLGIIGIFAGNAAVAGLILFWFVLEWFYGGILECFWNGQTPGKRMTGIRVVSINGQPIDGLQATLRNILRAVDMMPLLPAIAFGFPESYFVIPTFMIGLLSPLFNQRFQRLGDIVCGTMVIVEDRRWLLGVVKVDDPQALELASALPANFQVSRNLGQALSAYVERRKFFSQARRREIARHVAEPLLSRYDLKPDTNYDLFLCALYHRAFVADRTESRDVTSVPSMAPTLDGQDTNRLPPIMGLPISDKLG